MEFKQAMEMMKSGNKVFSKSYPDWIYYIEKYKMFVINESGSVTEATEPFGWFWDKNDWEIYYKETLSNKYLDYEEVYKIKEHGFFYKEVAIKKSLEGLKQLIDKYLDSTANKLNMLEDVRKIFGDRLI